MTQSEKRYSTRDTLANIEGRIKRYPAYAITTQNRSVIKKVLQLRDAEKLTIEPNVIGSFVIVRWIK